MQLIVIATLALVAAAAAAPAAPAVPAAPAAPAAHAAHADPNAVKIVRSEFEQQPEGNYVFNYETDDGTKREETGEVKSLNDEENKPHDVVVMRGTYSYVDPEGKPHSFTYYADQDGFHIEGEDVPKVQQ